jgi:hypothetical protein
MTPIFKPDEQRLQYIVPTDRIAGALYAERHYQGALVKIDGIYACEFCGFEVVLRKDDIFPMVPGCQLHSEHWKVGPNQQSAPRWQLVAAPRTIGKGDI